jgi:hypothetical protein
MRGTRRTLCSACTVIKEAARETPPRAGEDGKMDLHVFLYDGIVRDWVEIKFQAPTPSTRRWGSRKSTQVRDKDPADRDAASDVGCYFTVGDQTFTSDILLNTNEPNFRYLRRPESRPPRRPRVSRRHLLRVRLPGQGHSL